jgi:HSP20 family molecular chaperone IbpA
MIIISSIERRPRKGENNMTMLVNKLFLDTMFPESLFPNREEFSDGPTFNSLLREKNYRTDAAYILQIPLPGIAKEDISIKVKENNKLEVRASRKFDGKETSIYTKNYTLNELVDVANISSKYNNGLLHIELPFKVAKPVSIDVAIQ